MFTTNKKVDKLLTLYLPLTMLLSFTLFPIYWTINTAFKPEGDIVKRPLQYMPVTRQPKTSSQLGQMLVLQPTLKIV